MSACEVFLTQKGFEKLKEELDFLKRVKRREVAQQLERARLMGDLSENAEYDAAKETQAYLEKKILELEDKLARARIIEHENISADKVYVGASVKLLDKDSGELMQYVMVSSAEADFAQDKISIESPIGKALLGHKKDDVVEIKVPAGLLKYQIIEISR